jgi:hypothetical protein
VPFAQRPDEGRGDVLVADDPGPRGVVDVVVDVSDDVGDADGLFFGINGLDGGTEVYRL